LFNLACTIFFGKLGPLPRSKIMYAFPCKIGFGWRICFKTGDGIIAAYALIASKPRNHPIISLSIVASSCGFGSF
jgi:hypothetical protein